MQHFCKYNPKSEQCAAWFNKVCTQCREQFPSKGGEQRFEEELQKPEVGLLTAEECHSSIRSIEAENVNSFFKDDIWWKVPLVLLICGSILVTLISFCSICLRFVDKLQKQVPQNVDIDVCERNINVSKRRCQCCDSEPTDRKSTSTSKIKPNKPQRTLYY